MSDIFLGGIAFLLFIVYDMEQAKLIPMYFHNVIQFFFLIGFFLITISTIHIIQPIMVAVFSFRFFVGITFAILFLLLLFYTLFFALPFKETYVSQNGKQIYDRGMYALCRHPGVLWFSGFYISLWFSLDDIKLFWLAFFYIGFNIGYILFQDKITFPCIFADYGDYCKRVPFLVPTLSSLKECFMTKRKESR